MLKRMFASTAVLALFALPLGAQANAGNQVSLTGKVIDVNCYTTHQLSGAQHKNCATACANKGPSRASASVSYQGMARRTNACDSGQSTSARQQQS